MVDTPETALVAPRRRTAGTIAVLALLLLQLSLAVHPHSHAASELPGHCATCAQLDQPSNAADFVPAISVDFAPTPIARWTSGVLTGARLCLNNAPRAPPVHV